MALLVVAACSSLADTETGSNYAANGGSAVPGNTPDFVEPTPASPTSAGQPIPTSDPDNGENPGATETNFLTLPCNTDADCGGSRCVLPADAGSTHGGAASDGGAPAVAGRDGGVTDGGVTDGGVTDAGLTQAFGRGRCSPGG